MIFASIDFSNPGLIRAAIVCGAMVLGFLAGYLVGIAK